MYLQANKNFKKYLQKEISKANRNVNELFIRHLKAIICFSPVEADGEVLKYLEQDDTLKLNFEDFKELALARFSSIFKITIAKYEAQFQERFMPQINTLTELKRLHSYYIDSQRFFNDFDTLENYLAKDSVSNFDEYCILNYYANCLFSFMTQELSVKSAEDIDKFLERIKSRYDALTLRQIKFYLENKVLEETFDDTIQKFNVCYPIINGPKSNGEVIHPMQDLWGLKLNLSAYQLSQLIACYQSKVITIDYAGARKELEQCGLEEPNVSSSQLVDAHLTRQLTKPNSN